MLSVTIKDANYASCRQFCCCVLPVVSLYFPLFLFLSFSNVELLSDGRRLVLSSASLADAGAFSCVAQNRAGESQVDFSVEVLCTHLKSGKCRSLEHTHINKYRDIYMQRRRDLSHTFADYITAVPPTSSGVRAWLFRSTTRRPRGWLMKRIDARVTTISRGIERGEGAEKDNYNLASLKLDTMSEREAIDDGVELITLKQSSRRPHTHRKHIRNGRKKFGTYKLKVT